jgi:hypothetical protein
MNSIAGLQTIFPTVKDGSEFEHLGKIAEDYPYFSIAQLYFLHHSNNALSFSEKHASKTALFFNNIYLLNWHLNRSNNEIVQESAEPDRTDEIISETSISSTYDVSPLEITANVESSVKKESLAFEPLHTTDYFASQGIKITEEPITNDKLGTQMKSFTEWLKSMKKIHTQNTGAADEQTDRKIQTIAEDSNTSTEIVTEAMADVLVKQNKNEKAIDMYRQLSLINPLKSAYFAAKIQSLKTQ